MKFYDEDKKEEKILEEKPLEEIKKDTDETKKSNNKKIVLVLILVFSILILIAFITTGFALLNINNIKIMAGVKINGIDVKKITIEEAENKVSEIMNEYLNKDIFIKGKDFEYSINLNQIEVKYKIQEAANEAYKIGRSGNIFQNNFEILKALVNGKNISIGFSYNEESLNKIVDDISVKVPDAVKETSYYVEDEKLIITKGKSGNSIKKEELKSEILNLIKNNSTNEIQVEIINKEPEPIDIDKVHEEIYTEPKDAYYTKDPFEIFPHVNGIDFDKEKAKEIIKEDKQEYEIKLKITEPKITTNKIGTEAFPDLLATFSTRYNSSQTGRTKNMQLAAAKIDGTVVMPGEIFSYNKTVGERTIAGGYTEAAGYAGGRVVQTLGGGICQVSSTIYDAVVYANLDVVERKNHMFLTSYVGAGKDATVVYGSIDFKFKNTRKHPIMLKTSVKNGIVKVDVFGIKEDIEYEVEISTKVLNYIPFKVVYETNNSLGAGKEKVVQGGNNGLKCITYKILKLNGKQISSSVLSTDIYDPMNKIIEKGPNIKKEVKSKTTKKEEKSTKETTTIEGKTKTKKEEEKTKETSTKAVNNEPKEVNNINKEVNNTNTVTTTNQENILDAA